MADSIIKYTVNLDKQAREAIEKLEQEKLGLDQKVKEEAKSLETQHKKENASKLEQNKKDYQEEIETRKVKELDHFNKQLKNMEEQFEKNQNQWIDEIFENCIKS